MLLVLGFFLGLGGASYAIGVPLADSSFPPARRGFAMGLFSASDIGVAIAGLTVIRMIDSFGERSIFFLVAALLLVVAALSWFTIRDFPGARPTAGMWESFAGAIRKPRVLSQSWLYAMTFGVYVALGVYAVTYFKGAYDTEPATASLYMAMLITVASVFRPIGGWLSDRLGPIEVLATVFVLVTVGALALSFTPALAISLTLFSVVTAACGTGASAVFTLLDRTTPLDEVPESSGVVGALGGMGGYFPPLVLGIVFGITASYRIAFLMLAAITTLTAIFTVTVVRRSLVRSSVDQHPDPTL
jgi:MFS transporter, NNP family, nitrate/nitrite transporter